MKDTLQKILTSIVEKPDAIVIDESETEGVITFTITVANEDMGRVIGKNGKIIKSIRNVLKIPAIKNNKKIFIALSENPQ